MLLQNFTLKFGPSFDTWAILVTQKPTHDSMFSNMSLWVEFLIKLLVQNFELFYYLHTNNERVNLTHNFEFFCSNITNSRKHS